MDPLGDMLNMMKNASLATKESVLVPYSNLKMAVLECLKKEGFVRDIEKRTLKGKPGLYVVLAYDGDGEGKIHTVQRISKPSRRMYGGVKELRTSKQVLGTRVLSTPKGILTDKNAKKEQVGGEILFTIF